MKVMSNYEIVPYEYVLQLFTHLNIRIKYLKYQTSKLSNTAVSGQPEPPRLVLEVVGTSTFQAACNMQS